MPNFGRLICTYPCLLILHMKDWDCQLVWVQFQEEQDHAMKFMNYLISKGNEVELKPVKG